MSTKKYKIITVESFYFTFLYFAPNYGSIYQSIDKWCERVGETWSGTTGGCCLGLRSCVAACLLIGPLGPRWGGLGVCGAQSRWWPLTPLQFSPRFEEGKEKQRNVGSPSSSPSGLSLAGSLQVQFTAGLEVSHDFPLVCSVTYLNISS